MAGSDKPKASVVVNAKNSGLPISKHALVAIVAIIIIIGFSIGGYFIFKGSHSKELKKQGQTSLQSFTQSSKYKNLNTDQQIKIRLSLVYNYMGVNAYQPALNELGNIQKDFPNAETNTDFLLLEFITNYELNNRPQASSYARKIKASGAIPIKYKNWEGLINQYASQ